MAKILCSSQLEPNIATHEGESSIILNLSKNELSHIKKRPVGKNIASFTARIPR